MKERRILYDKLALWFVIIAGAGLLFYTNYRAAVISITHDEAVISKMICENSAIKIFNFVIPQDHMINSLLMKWSCSVFPTSEYSMRLPNLLGHLLYIIFSILLLRKLKNPLMLAAGFVLLNFNPYLLDFFSIGRGYGLSVAFMMVSIYYIYSYILDKRTMHLTLAFLFGILAVLTVYTLINFIFGIIALVVISIFIFWVGSKQNPQARPGRLAMAAFLIIGASAMVLYAKLSGPLERIQGENFIYGLAHKNVYTGTIRPIVFRSIYNSDPGLTVDVVSWAFIGVYALVPLVVVFLMVRRDFAFTSRLLFTATVLSLIIAASITLQNYLFNIRFLSNRTATFIAPVMILAFIGLLDEFRRFRYLKVPAGVLAVIIAGVFMVNTLRHANFSHYLEWQYDADSKHMIRDLEKDAGPRTGDQVSLGIVWLFEPSVNFYRKSMDLNWLNEVNRDGYMADFDYYYVMKQDSVLSKDIFRDKTILKEYPISNTVLLKK
jgi:hypothetical protein